MLTYFPDFQCTIWNAKCPRWRISLVVFFQESLVFILVQEDLDFIAVWYGAEPGLQFFGGHGAIFEIVNFIVFLVILLFTFTQHLSFVLP